MIFYMLQSKKFNFMFTLNTQLPTVMSCVRPNRESFSDLPHTPATAQLHDASIMVVGQKLVESVPIPPGLKPGACGVRIHYHLRSPTDASLFFFLNQKVTNFCNDHFKLI